MERLTELLGYWNNSLPEKVDYADLVCAPAFSRGYSMVYEDEYGYMVEGTIKTLEELQQYKDTDLTPEQIAELKKNHGLPCEVGDTVYRISLNDIKEYKVFAINIGIRENASSCAILTKNSRGAVIDFELIDFGKTVFLSREEAESKLAEMEGGHE